VRLLLAHFVGYDALCEEGLAHRHLKNAPDVLKAWKSRSKVRD
jgi:hypothetical protein